MRNISKNFSREEFFVSESYPKLAWETSRTIQDFLKCNQIVFNVLQPIRDHANKRLVINSGKRSKRLNDAIGGVTSSQHRWIGDDWAVDFGFKNTRGGYMRLRDHSDLLFETYEWIMENLFFSFGQMIIYLTPTNLARFIHISSRTKKHQSEMMVKKNGGYFSIKDRIDLREFKNV